MHEGLPKAGCQAKKVGATWHDATRKAARRNGGKVVWCGLMRKRRGGATLNPTSSKTGQFRRALQRTGGAIWKFSSAATAVNGHVVTDRGKRPVEMHIQPG